MGKAVKFAISLPDDVFAEVEAARLAEGETRSEFFRRAVQTLLRLNRERAADDAYARAYREQPETPEEIAFARATSRIALEQEPWE